MADAPPFHRASELREDLDFLESALDDPRSVLLPVWREQTVVERGDPPRLHLPTVAQARGMLDGGGELAFLGMLDDRACFAVDVSRLPEPGGELSCEDLRFVGNQLPQWEAHLAAYARGVMHFHDHNPHCPRCGSRTRPRSGGHMRRCESEACGAEHFPRTDPAIIVLVQRSDEALLGRQRRWPSGMYSTLAGFVETGESVEDAVAREVHEESGVRVSEVTYFRSQPWPFPRSLMLGYTARAEGAQEPALDDELEDVRWFSRQQLRSPERTGIDGFFFPQHFSLAGQLIQHFLDQDT